MPQAWLQPVKASLQCALSTSLAGVVASIRLHSPAAQRLTLPSRCPRQAPSHCAARSRRARWAAGCGARWPRAGAAACTCQARPAQVWGGLAAGTGGGRVQQQGGCWAGATHARSAGIMSRAEAAALACIMPSQSSLQAPSTLSARLRAPIPSSSPALLLSIPCHKHHHPPLFSSSPSPAGKSLTVHEVVRQCWRPAAPAGGAAAEQQQQQQQQEEQQEGRQQGQVPPPALISINCMSLTDPQQVRGPPGGVCMHTLSTCFKDGNSSCHLPPTARCLGCCRAASCLHVVWSCPASSARPTRLPHLLPPAIRWWSASCWDTRRPAPRRTQVGVQYCCCCWLFLGCGPSVAGLLAI